MKTTLLLTFAVLASFTSARADVSINDDGTVTKNGVNLNNAWDALLNKQITNAEMAAAWNAKLADFNARIAEKEQQAAEAMSKATETLKSERDAAAASTATIRAEAEAAKQAANAAIEAAEAKKKQVEASYAALLAGAKAALSLPTSQERMAAAMQMIEQVQKSAAQREAEKLAAEIAEKQKKLAELQTQR